MKLVMGAHCKDTGFIKKMLSVCVSNAASFLMLVFDMIGLHMMLAYSKTRQVIALNVEKISFFVPHLIEMSTLKIKFVLLL